MQFLLLTATVAGEVYSNGVENETSGTLSSAFTTVVECTGVGDDSH